MASAADGAETELVVRSRSEQRTFFAVDADGLEDVAAAVGDGDVGTVVSAAAGEAGDEPLDSSAQAPSAAAPAPVRPRSPAARKMVRRVGADVSCCGGWSPSSNIKPPTVKTLFRRQTR
jgi:hypothetical protein